MDRPWTPNAEGANLVEQELIAAFREAQGRAIYSTPCGKLELIDGHHITGLELIALTATFLRRDSFDRLALLTWARAQAGGPSVSSICQHKGWKRTTFEEARRRASRLVAIGLHGVATGAIHLAEAVQPHLRTSVAVDNRKIPSRPLQIT